MKGRVLVTGISGFTGLYVRRALEARGYEVHGISNSPAPNSRDDSVDLVDAEALGRYLASHPPQYVIHLAGVSFVAHDKAADQYRINLLGAVNLLQSLLQNGASLKKVLLASSGHIYGRPDRCPIEETASPSPLSHYAVAKYSMELAARVWSDRLPVLVVRPFNYTGIGQSGRFVLPKIVDAFRSHSADLELGDTTVVREFMDVRDVAEIYARLLESSSTETVNIASGTGHRLAAVIEQLIALSGHSPRIVSSEALRRSNDIPELVGSAAKLSSIIGPPRFRPLRETLLWMLGGRENGKDLGAL